MKVLQKIVQFSEENHLISPNDSILVALSAGADSVTLLHILSKLRVKYALNLSAVYINHQLRTKEAKKEEIFCQKLCDSLGIDLFLTTVDIPKLAQKEKKGIEETARQFRYDLFENMITEYKFTKVALGHHLNDQVETILFRLFRGTGKTGFKGISAKREKFIRPLLCLTKNEILTYIKTHKLAYCQDSSNNESHYKRNFLRNKLIPQIKENLNSLVENAILNLSSTITEEEEFIERIVEKAKKKIVTSSVGNKRILDKKLFRQTETWIQKRILRESIVELSPETTYPDKETIELILKGIKANKKSFSLKQKLECTIHTNQIIISIRKRIKFKEKIDISETHFLAKLQYVLHSKIKKRVPKALKSNKNGMIARFDLEKLVQPLYIRSIENGDRFTPYGMRGSKKVGNYLTDKKIQPIFRDEIAVVCDKNGIIWIIGHQIDERVKIDTRTKKVLEIECKRKK